MPGELIQSDEYSREKCNRTKLSFQCFSAKI